MKTYYQYRSWQWLALMMYLHGPFSSGDHSYCSGEGDGKNVKVMKYYMDSG